VRQAALPPPGDDEALRQLSARIFSQRLDRHKPLWELRLVEALAGDRFAIISKTHQALVDGVDGADILTVIFDSTRFRWRWSGRGGSRIRTVADAARCLHVARLDAAGGVDYAGPP